MTLRLTAWGSLLEAQPLADPMLSKSSKTLHQAPWGRPVPPCSGLQGTPPSPLPKLCSPGPTWAGPRDRETVDVAKARAIQGHAGDRRQSRGLEEGWVGHEGPARAL